MNKKWYYQRRQFGGNQNVVAIIILVEIEFEAL